MDYKMLFTIIFFRWTWLSIFGSDSAKILWYCLFELSILAAVFSTPPAIWFGFESFKFLYDYLYFIFANIFLECVLSFNPFSAFESKLPTLCLTSIYTATTFFLPQSRNFDDTPPRFYVFSASNLHIPLAHSEMII